jgi:hypothetical protein
LAFAGKAFAKQHAGPAQARPEVRRRDLQDLTDFFSRDALDFPHDKGLLKVLGQTGHAICKGQAQGVGVAIDVALGLLPVAIFLKLAVDKALAIVSFGGDETLVAAGLAAEMIQNLVMQNAGEPRQLSGLASKALVIGQGRGEGVLQEILGGLWIADAAEGKAPEGIAVFLEPDCRVAGCGGGIGGCSGGGSSRRRLVVIGVGHGGILQLRMDSGDSANSEGMGGQTGQDSQVGPSTSRPGPRAGSDTSFMHNLGAMFGHIAKAIKTPVTATPIVVARSREELAVESPVEGYAARGQREVIEQVTQHADGRVVAERIETQRVEMTPKPAPDGGASSQSSPSSQV